MEIPKIDVESHNQEQSAVWDAYHAGRPERVPVVFTMNPRMILLDPELNDRGVTFADYVGNPALMMETQLKYHYWRRHNVLCDWPMGIPECEWEPFVPDWQNYQDAAWFGCELATHEGMMPRTYPMFQREKELLYDCAMPDDLLRGHAPQIYERYVYGLEYAADVDFHGRPMALPAPLFAVASHTLSSTSYTGSSPCLSRSRSLRIESSKPDPALAEGQNDA